MIEKCGAGYMSAVWGQPKPVVWICELPKGHAGYHYGVEGERSVYTKWPQVTVTTGAPERG